MTAFLGAYLPSTRPAIDWHAFHAFSVLHGAVLIVFFLLATAACLLGRRFSGTSAPAFAERFAGYGMLALWAFSAIYWIVPPNKGLAEALPIHLCDVVGLIAALVLITRAARLRALLYFWGIGLCTQAMLTPILTDGPATLRFWLFWLSHAAIIGTAAYDLLVHRFRPTLRDLLWAIAACAVWLGVVLVVDLTFDVNYGYVGNITPERPTIVDSLGPWPGRVFIMSGMVLALFVTMWMPWAIARRWDERRTGASRADAGTGATHVKRGQ